MPAIAEPRVVPQRRGPSLLLTLGVPVSLLAVAFVAAATGGVVRDVVLDSPTGVFETLTGLMALAAGIFGYSAFIAARRRFDWRVRAWLLAYVLAMVYFAGEDLNWGQYYFGWTPSEFFLAHNNEQETNLHNMSSWFNQKPRAVVELWLFVACILVPLGARWPRRLLARLVPHWFWPDRRIVYVASLALLLKVPKTLETLGAIDSEILYGVRTSELQEVLFAYAFLLYALLLKRRAAASVEGRVRLRHVGGAGSEQRLLSRA